MRSRTETDVNELTRRKKKKTIHTSININIIWTIQLTRRKKKKTIHTFVNINILWTIFRAIIAIIFLNSTTIVFPFPAMS